MQQEILTKKSVSTSRNMKILHFILYFWVYLVQSTFAVHFGTIANYYFKKNLGYSWNMLALINFLVYLPVIAKPLVYILMQRKTNLIHIQKLLIPFTSCYLITTILTGFITSTQSPVLMLIAMFVMQTSLVPVDLGMDSYFLTQYQKHSLGISLMQIGSMILGTQIIYFLVARFTDYYAAQSWMIYFILLGLVAMPLIILELFIQPKAVETPAQDFSTLKKLEHIAKKRLKLLLVFLVGINITYLSGSIMDVFLPVRFGEEAYVNQIGAISSLWGILGIVIMFSLGLVSKVFRTLRFPLLYLIGVVVSANFITMVYSSLSIFLVFRILGIILTYIFQAIYLSLMIEAIPKQVLPPFYQMCAMVIAVTRAVLEPLGIILSQITGMEVVFLITAGIMLLNIPIVMMFSKLLKKPKIE